MRRKWPRLYVYVPIGAQRFQRIKRAIMGREIRMVPPNWEHPHMRCPHSPWNGGCDDAKKNGGMCHKQLYDRPFSEAANEWKEAFAAWERGERESYCDEDSAKGEYWEWAGNPPERDDYRPEWKDGEATWYQVYQTVGEGSPVTPPFATKEELVEYLVQHGDFWAQSRGEGGVSRKAAEAFVMGDEKKESENADQTTALRHYAQELDAKDREIADLRNDIERHIAAASTEANARIEAERQLAEALTKQTYWYDEFVKVGGQLAEARKDALEEAAIVADNDWTTSGHGVQAIRIATAIRGLKTNAAGQAGACPVAGSTPAPAAPPTQRGEIAEIIRVRNEAIRENNTQRERAETAERQLKNEQGQSASYLANWQATEKGYNELDKRRIEVEHQRDEAIAETGRRVTFLKNDLQDTSLSCLTWMEKYETAERQLAEAQKDTERLAWVLPILTAPGAEGDRRALQLAKQLLAGLDGLPAIDAALKGGAAMAERCPRCNGTGRVERMSFSTPRTIINKSCSVCKATGFLPEDKDASIAELKRQLAVHAKAIQELENIVNAKRFDRKMFRDDTEWADWAQSRARHALSSMKRDEKP